MNVADVFDRIERATNLESDDAAIRIRAEYAPQAGPAAKVFPPTYLPTGGSRYHFEERWEDGERVPVVVLDSIQSQANRAERALLDEAADLRLPQIVLETELADRTVRISNLAAPHRSRDAYFLDSEVDGIPFDETPVGQALRSVTADDATPALRHAPFDLVYGVWDSHRGQRVPMKFPRTYTSEMLGWHAVAGKRAATKGDQLNLPGQSTVPTKDWRPDMVSGQKKKAQVKLSELGHGMVPGQPDAEAGGVSVRAITREAVLSLTGLARLYFPLPDGDVTSVGRAALAAVALLGDRLAFARAGLNLRSGSDLVLVSDRVEWVQAGGVTETLELSASDARELVSLASERLASAGVTWSGEPLVVQPTDRLRRVIEETFYVPDLDAEA
jgi:CRISPR-associated protein Csb1